MIAVHQGDSPIVLGFPHVGTHVPPAIAAHLNDTGRAIADTDWHVDRLYADLVPGATTVKATTHRYVIDVNRDPAGKSLYPEKNTTTLVPLTDFDGMPIWSRAPTDHEIAQRRDTFHTPYHAALSAELDRVRNLHGVAILFDCHSIRSRIPYLIDGPLPDFNIGTNNGTTCAPSITDAVHDICVRAAGYTCVLNGRFKGGWTTRHYGRPDDGIHAIQMELAQYTYLTAETHPWAYDPAKAARLRPHLAAILNALVALAPQLKGLP